MVLCKKNNKRYYGSTNSVSSRLSKHKSDLIKGQSLSPDMQADFNLYGLKEFDFQPVYFCQSNNPRQEALNKEMQLIQSFAAVNLVYNKQMSGSRTGSGNPYFGKKHSTVTRQRMSATARANRQAQPNRDGIPVVVKGNHYPSLTKASEATGHSRDTIRRWLNDPTKQDSYYKDSAPAGSAPPIGSTPSGLLSVNQGVPKPLIVDAKHYKSVADAAKGENCSRARIQYRLRTEPQKVYFIQPDK